MKFYPLADPPNFEDCRNIPDFNKKTLAERITIASNIRAIRTGEFRRPKKGEWYISGAIVQAWRAPNDLTTEFHIVKLVLTETKRIVKEVIVKKL